MPEKDYVLGTKARELYRYTKKVTRPVPDDKVDAKDVAKVLRTIARAQTPEQMQQMLNTTAERLEKKRQRPRFPKSETFDMIADIRSAARAIMRGVHSANETNFRTDPEIRLQAIKTVIDECNLLLQYIEISKEEGYIDKARMETWTKKTTDVKYMSMSWLKKDGARARVEREKQEAEQMQRISAIVAETVRATMEQSAAGRTAQRPAGRSPGT